MNVLNLNTTVTTVLTIFYQIKDFHHLKQISWFNMSFKYVFHEKNVLGLKKYRKAEYVQRRARFVNVQVVFA